MPLTDGLSRRDLLGASAAGLLGFRCTGSPAPAPTARTGAVVFVRHAEKAKAPAGDPDLTDRGRVRAKALAGMLASCGVTRLFATELLRTQATLRPLSERLGLEIERYSAREPARFADRLAMLAGEVTVVAGHADTLPAMIAKLGGELAGLDDRNFMDDSDYDRVVVQILLAGDAEAPMRALQTLDLRLVIRAD